jgi:hypothetical protein
MMFSKKSLDGYLMVDHRASPGLPEDIARQAGYDPALCREGKTFEQATLGCYHCGAHVVVNPLRTRDRGWCSKCDRYICDACAAAMKETGYVHRNIHEIADMVHTGKWELSGAMSRPILTPKLIGD